MKNFLKTIWNHVKKHGWAYFWAVWFGFSTYNITKAVSRSIEKNEARLQAAHQETADLREKINNHLIAEGFYNKPAKEVLPVMKEFGIGL
jgi:hypothetical protein